MREQLLSLINKTIVYKYDLPNHSLGIDRSIFSTENDRCYSTICNQSLIEIIYNSIIEYSFNEFDINGKEYDNLHAIALKTKLKYNEVASETSKISYGFHGETILYCILYAKMDAKPVISRGYFYNPLESSETKGYDSYHLIERNGTTELWFGEVKFRNNHTSGINSAIDSIEKAISDAYLSTNFLAITNHKNNFNISGTKVEEIISKWEENPLVDIIEEIKKYDIKLIYPIIIIYDIKDDYDNSIKIAIEHIKNNHSLKTFSLSIPYSIYFIWLPVDKVRDIKAEVIKWIEQRKPLI
ncbi:hypothetical protein NRS6084_00107 [Bacillus subtilis]|uniref:Anti-bacteriophage protein A/HamA C-terminal domain-containing protein n=1 Tax=Bacillus subtilis TaxID=1423 RepID=A0AAP1HA70_BACIU|nr:MULTISPECIES: Hachiman antiphage defense system protein HamA [Bacillus subtilis group]KIN51575.1 hypothetical protein B4146_4347 [Bacillus subtilis]KZD93154.1 hypothetical protein B4122_1298 [Bacillus subtilis]MCY9097355.1 DUF1837 domain-containing protein [Bacillus inaquosorum]MEC0547059.1 SAVED domain-containing protein [Bacillus inaquosorum]CAF1718251.1 hypothetical protein NRS6084_00107 [Bacillus subtilis]